MGTIKVHLGIQDPTVLGDLPSNQGVITYYFVGFGGHILEDHGD